MAFITQRGEVHAAGLSKQQKRETSELEALVSGVNSVSQATLLLKKMRESREVDDALEYMKEQYTRRMAACEERQAAFERRQAEMRAQVAKFEKFITENDAKSARAEAKAKAEKQMYRTKCREREALAVEYETTEKERNELVHQLSRLKRYQRYLEQTVEESDDADEVWDLLNRHVTLRDANRDLMAQVTTGEDAIEGLRSELQAATLAHTNAMLVNNSAVHAKQQKVELLRRLNKDGAEAQDRREEDKKGGTREVGQVVLAIRNTFLRCTTTMATKTSVGADPDLSGDYRQLVSTLDGQLRAVMERITDLTDMELGFPHWQAKRRHEEALRLEAAAEARAELAGALPSSGLEQSSLSLAPSTNAQPRGGGGSGR